MECLDSRCPVLKPVLLHPEEIRYIRKDVLKLSQEEAGRIFNSILL